MASLWNTLLNLPQETQGFIAFIAILWLFFQFRFTSSAVSAGPTILTTAGIFATFFGIAKGLSNFDVTNIAASVPELLNSLKTAFWASVAGVGGAFFINLRCYFFPPRPKTGDTSSRSNHTTAADLERELGKIYGALAGSGSDSLISTVKLQRQDINDGLRALREAQTEALQKLSELGSRQLVDALQQTIKDFNKNLTEQFGENFKELNVAVHKLVEWQELYRQEMSAAVDRLTQTAGATTQIVENHDKLLANSVAFSSVAEDLGYLIGSLERQKQEFASLSERLAGLFQTASNSLPQFEKQITDLTKQLTTAVTDNQREVSQAIQHNVTAVRNTLETQSQNLTKANEAHNKHVADLIGKTDQHVKNVDEALRKELTASLTSLGEQLTALSEHFVKDYTPLTTRLKEIVQMARP